MLLQNSIELKTYIYVSILELVAVDEPDSGADELSECRDERHVTYVFVAKYRYLKMSRNIKDLQL